MTVREYNKEFLPKITMASCFISLFDNIVSHIDKEKADHEELWRIFKIYGWSEEMKNLILEALEYYRIHEGIEKIVMRGDNL